MVRGREGKRMEEERGMVRGREGKRMEEENVMVRGRETTCVKVLSNQI